jgi:signal-transduction protein with cAMP-binding, CBS, and nucleotidyltransferase domain
MEVNMLSSKVSEIMTTNLTTAPVSTPIFEVMERMATSDVGRIIITDNEVPVGIFTERDVLRRVVNSNIDAKKTSIKEVMTSPLRAVREETHIVEAFGKMFRGKYRHLLVRGKRGRIVGIVSMRRILKLAVELGQGMSETKTLGSLTTPVINTTEQSLSIYDTIDLMVKKGASAVIVTEEGKPVGIFTERDVLKRVATRGIDTHKTTVGELMTAPLVTMPDTALIGDVLAEMYRRDIRNMPVSRPEGKLVGLVSMSEILQYARAFDIDEKVRRTWKEVAEYLDNEDQYTPG